MRKEGWFEIDSEGFSVNQSYREPWTLVRELISNAFDESITECHVEIAAASDMGNGAKRGVWITVQDDGPGFANPRDIYTLYGPTRKKLDPELRGRWNSGEKEFLGVAREAIVQTKGCTVSFGKQRKISRKGIEKGTLIKALMPWRNGDILEIADMLRLFIPPVGVCYSVSIVSAHAKEEHKVNRPRTLASIDATLPTVIDSGAGLRPTKRKTCVNIYDTPDSTGWLFEMGIPIQAIDAPYLVSVEQKVPLDPNRNVVTISYLKNIYAILLNAVHEEIHQEGIAESWVSEAIQHDQSSTESRRYIYETKYGKTLLRSTEAEANEEAVEAGYQLIDSRRIPKKERENLADFGLVPAGKVFKPASADFAIIPQSEWTDGMKATVRIAAWMARSFLDVERLTVRFIRSPKATVRADYGDQTVRYNFSKLGGEEFFALPLSPEVIRLTLHEICHERGNGHDVEYRQTIERVAAEAMLHIATNPGEFQALIEGGPIERSKL